MTDSTRTDDHWAFARELAAMLSLMTAGLTSMLVAKSRLDLWLGYLQPLEVMLRRLLVLRVTALPEIALPAAHKRTARKPATTIAAPLFRIFEAAPRAQRQGGPRRLSDAAALAKLYKQYGMPPEHLQADCALFLKRLARALAVLDDPDRHAARLARWQARQDIRGTERCVISDQIWGLGTVLTGQGHLEIIDLHHLAHQALAGPLSIRDG